MLLELLPSDPTSPFGRPGSSAEAVRAELAAHGATIASRAARSRCSARRSSPTPRSGSSSPAGSFVRYRRLDDGYIIGFWSPDADHADVFGGHWSIAAGRAEPLRVRTHPPPLLAPPGRPRPSPSSLPRRR